jgi:hypothetical protein
MDLRTLGDPKNTPVDPQEIPRRPSGDPRRPQETPRRPKQPKQPEASVLPSSEVESESIKAKNEPND